MLVVILIPNTDPNHVDPSVIVCSLYLFCQSPLLYSLSCHLMFLRQVYVYADRNGWQIMKYALGKQWQPLAEGFWTLFGFGVVTFSIAMMFVILNLVVPHRNCRDSGCKCCFDRKEDEE